MISDLRSSIKSAMFSSGLGFTLASSFINQFYFYNSYKSNHKFGLKMAVDIISMIVIKLHVVDLK